MKKKETKGIIDNMRIDTMPDLLRRITEEWTKRIVQADVEQKANKARLIESVQKEEEIISTISREKKIAQSLQADYFRLEAGFEKEAREKAEKGILREKDLRTGKVKLADFLVRGKKDAAIESEISKNVGEELAAGLKVIKMKGLEILRLRETLLSVQNTIRSLIVAPGVYMQQVLKGLKSFTDLEVGDFVSELSTLRTEWEGIKQLLLLCQGKSIYGHGKTWDTMSVEEAKSLVFDPVIPIELTGKLNSELASCQDDDQVGVVYLLRTKDIDVQVIRKGRLISTSDRKREGKILTTHNLEDKKNG